MALLHSVLQYLDISTILLCFTVFIIASWLVQNYLKPKNLPPGPTNWPIVGCVPEMLLKRKPFHEFLEVLGQEYGPVCLLRAPLGPKAVIISGYEAVHEALNNVEFDHRFEMPTLKVDHGDIIKGVGVIMAEGEVWKEHRRFSLTVLRGLGVGKRSFEERIASESECLITEIQSLEGSQFDPTHLLCNAVSNIICSVVFGNRFEYDDPLFKRMLYLLEDSMAHAGIGFMYLAVPFLQKVPFLPKAGLPSTVSLRQQFQENVDEHRETLDKENLRDYIDAYINHVQVRKEQDVQTYMSDTELLAVLNDLFLAGTETVSTTLRWALLFMMMYPDVQQRVHEEIDSVVGRNRLPKMSDKPNLPYTEAVINEIQRYGGVVLFAGIRYTVEDTQFRGYTIPKGSYVMTNMRSVSRDPKLWEEPNEFKPERFLDDEGRFKKVKEGIVFGSGPRVCLGEQLARMELFIFFTHLMHRFIFKKTSDTDTYNMEPHTGMVLAPFHYKMCAMERT